MSKGAVIISCVPRLNEAQQQGMLNLINDIEVLGYTVYLWTDYDDVLSDYKLTYNDYNRGKATLNYLQTQLRIDSEKWIVRLQRWNNTDSIIAKEEFNNAVKDCLKIFTAIEPVLFICWNPWSCRYGIAYDMARLLNIKTAAIEWGYLPATFILDKVGTLAASEIFNTDPFKDFSLEQVTNFLKIGENIYSQLNETSLSLYNQAQPDIPKEFLIESGVKILVLGIDEIDSGAYPGEHDDRKGLLPYHNSSFDQAADIAAADTGYRVIYKPHPAHNRYKNNLTKDNLAVVNGDPDVLIDWADVVFCSGSKMEFSVMLKGKPLLTYGTGLLYGKNCSYEVKIPAMLKQQIIKALSKADADLQTHNFKAFLGYLSQEYLYKFDGNKVNLAERILSADQNRKN
ncbi:hypothetical protein EOD41_06625 [Mucilaginibacter limnophilus]|uniref:Capsular biosynthesis protein n=1 Tax=Mucilaginibacter limnophilus TaxID=1932778 RepID=A0A437MVE6_9SPHI|nr:hypothetical protein [Mucilaginibacter limnophilus]RVU01631.1 hypothetical protein EOD41_06625 [Mucilaginibacter limnophilus]